jgi:3-deoxy-D-manno-octulosonic-acid transferase
VISPSFYRVLSAAATPLVKAKLRQRVTIGKEDPARLGERLGRAGLARPDGPLVWIHAVSVGETISIQPVVKRLFDSRPAVEVLLTTGTTTSARMLAGRMLPRCRHQFVPVDLPAAVDRFLDHWRPDLGIFVESEFWPNLVLSAARRGVPLALVNGRMTERTWHQWRRTPRLIAEILGAFTLLLARSETDAARLTGLGAPAVRCLGDLKYAAPPLDVDHTAEAALRGWIGDRPLWLAASTHDGEDGIVAAAHRRLRATRPRLLTIIVPRHPERGAAIAAELTAAGYAVAQRSRDAAVKEATEIYVADTLGELGLFYRLAEIVFVGGSLVPTGGHNLLEPARLDCAILHGPRMTNFADMAAVFRAADAATEVTDADSLAAAVGDLLADPAGRHARAAAAGTIAAEASEVLDAVLDALGPLLDRAVGAEVADAGA